MSPVVLLLFALLISSGDVLAQGAASSEASTSAAARAKPTAAEKRCFASRRRVERQHEVIAEADARLAKERKAREACKTKRACENLDRALKASETRQQRHAKQLEQFDGEAQRACAPLADAPK
jgi:hypothetical protein